MIFALASLVLIWYIKRSIIISTSLLMSNVHGTKFWFDVWCGEISRKDCFLTFYILEIKMLVADYWYLEDGFGDWNLKFIGSFWFGKWRR